MLLGIFLAFGAKYLEHNWTVAHAHPIGASTGILAALIMAGVTAYHWEHGTGSIRGMATQVHDHTAAHEVRQRWS